MIPPPATAYLHACIDTRSNTVTQVVCMSDARPTVVRSHLVWALLFDRSAPSFAEARAAVLETVRTQPYWQWCRALMPERNDVPTLVVASPARAVRAVSPTVRRLDPSDVRARTKRERFITGPIVPTTGGK